MLVVDVGRLRRRVRLGQQLTGIDRVTVEYLAWAQSCGHRSCAKLGRYLRELPREHAELVQRHATSQWTQDSGLQALKPWRLRLDDALLGLRSRRVRNALIINTAQSWLQEAAVWEDLRLAGNRVVSFIHDLIPITHPHYNRSHAKALHEARLRLALRHAAGLIVNSRHTLDVLSDWARGEGASLPPAVVLPLGVRHPDARSGLPRNTGASFVVLGTIEPRKNHLLLLRVWKRLVDAGCSPMPRLVILGKIGWLAEPFMEFLADSSEIAPFVELRHSVTDGEVRKLLGEATALLFPSFAEGYGLPLVEALACGTPVIASELPAFREIAGDIPDYADPDDDERWEMLVRGYMDEKTGLSRAARARLAGYQVPEWKRHFASLELFLESLD
jgi:glycosyltransferase involved in cell wall biosynthesis